MHYIRRRKNKPKRNRRKEIAKKIYGFSISYEGMYISKWRTDLLLDTKTYNLHRINKLSQLFHKIRDLPFEKSFWLAAQYRKKCHFRYELIDESLVPPDF